MSNNITLDLCKEYSEHKSQLMQLIARADHLDAQNPDDLEHIADLHTLQITMMEMREQYPELALCDMACTMLVPARWQRKTPPYSLDIPDEAMDYGMYCHPTGVSTFLLYEDGALSSVLFLSNPVLRTNMYLFDNSMCFDMQTNFTDILPYMSEDDLQACQIPLSLNHKHPGAVIIEGVITPRLETLLAVMHDPKPETLTRQDLYGPDSKMNHYITNLMQMAIQTYREKNDRHMLDILFQNTVSFVSFIVDYARAVPVEQVPDEDMFDFNLLRNTMMGQYSANNMWLRRQGFHIPNSVTANNETLNGIKLLNMVQMVPVKHRLDALHRGPEILHFELRYGATAMRIAYPINLTVMSPNKENPS